MPEFVTCPACGLRVQTAEGLLGRRVRCFACDHRFVASAELPSAARRDAWPTGGPAGSAGGPGGTPGSRTGSRPPGEWGEEPLPFCPGCGRQVPWEVLRCPFCDEELEPETAPARRQPGGPPRRLDFVPHRGKLLVTLGNVSMALGGLSLCTLGIGALASVPLGITAWVLAGHDLKEMRAGLMDPRGKAATETGRTGGILGVVLGLIFGIFYAVVYLTSF
jgi:hypothetical protein